MQFCAVPPAATCAFTGGQCPFLAGAFGGSPPPASEASFGLPQFPPPPSTAGDAPPCATQLDNTGSWFRGLTLRLDRYSVALGESHDNSATFTTRPGPGVGQGCANAAGAVVAALLRNAGDAARRMRGARFDRPQHAENEDEEVAAMLNSVLSAATPKDGQPHAAPAAPGLPGDLVGLLLSLTGAVTAAAGSAAKDAAGKPQAEQPQAEQPQAAPAAEQPQAVPAPAGDAQSPEASASAERGESGSSAWSFEFA